MANATPWPGNVGRVSAIEQWLKIAPDSKPAVYLQVFESAEIADLNYWLELLFSAGIATLGLVLNSSAVVIGAMLISPLMGPIIAAGLALAAADLHLGFKALVNLAVSIFVAVAFSALLVWLLPFQQATAEVLARTRPNLLDLGVAILSGLAGSVIVCRGGGGGGVSALPGVAIAVALMPPLCTVGFGVGAGFQSSIMFGASLLFVTNLAAIVTAAFLVFLALHIGHPAVRERVHPEIAARYSDDGIYGLLQRTRFTSGLNNAGKMRFRILMPVIVLAVLFVPLRQGLQQVRQEVVARNAVREAIARIVPADSVLSQQVDLGPGEIHLNLILTASPEKDKVAAARALIMKRTGQDVDLRVRKVAGEQELAMLKERLERPAAPAPQPVSLQSMRAEAIARLDAPLQEIWPADKSKLLSYELGFDAEGVVVHVKYEAEQPLEPASAAMLQKFLQTRLGVEQLRLQLENVPPPPPPPEAKAAAKARRTAAARRKR